ncbi:MAG: DUF3575 domain-containing protein [Muribaculaceae bacterium]|nr:DUF3575 domain-containing protein [Muribaculaceae bacterium]
MRLKRILQVFLAAVGLIVWSGGAAQAQTVGLKTNLISDVALSPNVGIEIGLAPKWSLDISGQLNLWPIKGHKWKHAYGQPEVRYWFCQRFAGHFIGLHGIGGAYSVGNLNIPVDILGLDFHNLKKNRYQGWAAGAGFAYGYAWPVHKHWNIEAEIGVGWVYTRFDKYPCTNCGKKIESDVVRNYVGPTKLAVNVEYLF